MESSNISSSRGAPFNSRGWSNGGVAKSDRGRNLILEREREKKRAAEIEREREKTGAGRGGDNMGGTKKTKRPLTQTKKNQKKNKKKDPVNDP